MAFALRLTYIEGFVLAAWCVLWPVIVGDYFIHHNFGGNFSGVFQPKQLMLLESQPDKFSVRQGEAMALEAAGTVELGW